MEKKPYEFRIPVSKNVSDRILTPKMAKPHKGLELSLKKAVVSADAINLDIGERAKGKLEAWEDILKNQAGENVGDGLPSFRYAVVDDRGVMLQPAGQAGTLQQDNHWLDQAEFIPYGHGVNSITVKPYIEMKADNDSSQ